MANSNNNIPESIWKKASIISTQLLLDTLRLQYEDEYIKIGVKKNHNALKRKGDETKLFVE